MTTAFWTNESNVATLDTATYGDLEIVATGAVPAAGLFSINTALNTSGNNSSLVVFDSKGGTQPERRPHIMLQSTDSGGPTLTESWSIGLFYHSPPGFALAISDEVETDQTDGPILVNRISGNLTGLFVKDNMDVTTATALFIGKQVANEVRLGTAGNGTVAKGPLSLDEELVVPVLSADPSSPVNGEVWIYESGGTRELRARMNSGATTYATTLA